MYFADYHTHSLISPDGCASMLDMAKAAIEAGLDEICFTDHIEPITWEGALRQTYDWDALVAEFETAQDKVGTKILLRLGMELGEAPMNFSRTEQIRRAGPALDFVIGSIHRLSPRYDCQDLFGYVPKNDAEAYLAIADYLELVQKLVSWGEFTVLGHLTLPLRYFNEIHGQNISFTPFLEQVSEIFKTLIDKGLGIELNANRNNMPLPDAQWLQLYRDLGGTRITIGSDAHTPKQVALGVYQGQVLLKSCGFTQFCTFEKEQEIWHSL